MVRARSSEARRHAIDPITAARTPFALSRERNKREVKVRLIEPRGRSLKPRAQSMFLGYRRGTWSSDTPFLGLLSSYHAGPLLRTAHFSTSSACSLFPALLRFGDMFNPRSSPHRPPCAMTAHKVTFDIQLPWKQRHHFRQSACRVRVRRGLVSIP